VENLQNTLNCNILQSENNFEVMNKQKITMEFQLKAGSSNAIWTLISTPTGLSTWFANHVDCHDKKYSFSWNKDYVREAVLTHSKTNSYVRFRWTDEADKRSYFEFRMVYNELTRDFTLLITDWATADEAEDIQDLWVSDVEKLRRVGGL